MPAYILFNGHPPNKKNLLPDRNDACIDGVGAWRAGHTKHVTDDMAAWLLTLNAKDWTRFVEVADADGTPLDPPPAPKPAPVRSPRSPRARRTASR